MYNVLAVWKNKHDIEILNVSWKRPKERFVIIFYYINFHKYQRKD